MLKKLTNLMKPIATLYIYEVFPKLEIKIKPKKLISHWISKGIMKSSEQKQKLYNNFLNQDRKKMK